jgi:hypothetical protein
MAELLLVSNPHKRRRKARKNPHRRRHARKNPHRRRRARLRRNPHRRRHSMRFRHRNPSLRSITSGFVPMVKDSLMGAGGALANDFLYGFLSPYVNNMLSGVNLGGASGFLQYGFKLVTAMGAGYLGGLLKLDAKRLSEGAATVATHDFLKGTLQQFAPSIFGSGGTLALSGYSGLGAYLSGSAPIVGSATFPATYLPNQQPVQMGAYLSGSSGMSDGESGMYNGDTMGCDHY